MSDLLPQKTLQCKFCLQDFGLREILPHHKQCSNVPVSCPNNCETENITRGLLQEHLEKCSIGEKPCKFHKAGCKFHSDAASLEKHENEALREHLELLCVTFHKQENNLKAQSLALEEQKYEISQLRKLILEQRDKIDNYEKMQGEISHLKSLVNNLKPAVNRNTKETPINNVKKRDDKTVKKKEEEKVQGLMSWSISALKAISTAIDDYFKPDLNWCIYEAFEKLQSNKKELSPVFYSQEGYKLQLFIAYRDGVGPEDFISLEVNFLKGDNDSNLTWPFPGTITIRIKNTGGHPDFTYTFKKRNFRIYKPTNRKSTVVEIDNLISHQKLYKENFLLGDLLHILVAVTIP